MKAENIFKKMLAKSDIFQFPTLTLNSKKNPRCRSFILTPGIGGSCLMWSD